ncbi:ATP-binding cassette domain-containing protein [Pontibacter korlensis]|uniref:ABC transporter n=1 Tax=Pontibacter korlensis TaxID=400092 RepID=A0A0E3UXY2_9BACT|nr:ATP-binding cassette domain-containing protein [Pontibacter korlensis]AKD03996.1 ABC transporter [Pontibacter korlensis]
MPSSQPILTLDNITVRNLNKTLFTNLSFTVNKGEHWALIGESSSGATDLLQTLTGKYNVTRGSISHTYYEEYLQRNPQQTLPFTHHDLLAEVMQKHNFKNLSSNSTEFYYQQRYHASDSEDAPTVAAYLSDSKPATTIPSFWTQEQVVLTFSLEKLLDKQLIKLSNGETKRLLLAAALLKNPKVLLLDYPLTGLDVETRSIFSKIIQQITKSGITVIMSASATEVPAGITHVAIMEDHKIGQAIPLAFYTPAQVTTTLIDTIKVQELQELLYTDSAAQFDTIVQMEDVSIKYGEKLVLDSINWHIQQGDQWALLGHNGAGKSTLLSLITGDNPQSYAQKIVLFDRRRGSGETIWDIKKRIGFVSPELYQYFPHQNTCLEVVESGFHDTLGLTRGSDAVNAEKAFRWMRIFGMEQEAHKLLRDVSTDVQRLCLLARAIVKNPPLLILDEPCQGMNQHQKLQFKKLLDTICTHSNTTLVYVTHYPEEIPDSVTKVLQLKEGKVVSREITELVE